MLMISWRGSGNDNRAGQGFPDIQGPAWPAPLLSPQTRTAVDLVKAPIGTPEFFAECRIAALVKSAEPKPGTLGILIAAYRAHPAFTDLAPRTKSDYQAVFDYLKLIADTPLVRFDKPLVVRIRDKAAQDKGRKFANDVKARFSGIFGWGSERGYIASNPAAGIKDIRRRKDAPDANRPWADEERESVLAACPAHIKPAIGLMMFTGLGPRDALTLPKGFYKAGEIATRRSKTSEPVFWECPAPLAAILAEAPTHDAITLCANSDGKPWTISGFRASWRPIRLELERAGKVGPGLTLYGLRHTVAVILREIGMDERTIADALGQKTIEMARHYAKGADLAPKMRGVVKRFDEELAARKANKSVKPTE
jgi:integrase